MQKGQVPPCGVDVSIDMNRLACSFDGDADRIVFHAFKEDGSWVLYDGDKEAALAALMIFQEFNVLKDAFAAKGEEFSLGCVQTAYANGASTAFLRSNDVPVVFAKTGVKYLHHKAEDFDIGVYFEANGHGTILFSKRLLSSLTKLQVEMQSAGVADRKKVAVERLLACADVITQAVGDALSDMLLIIAALHILCMDMRSWESMYTDLPSKQLKVPVPNKELIRCSIDEMRTEEPKAMQIELDDAMWKVSDGRCFIRPSGTEDVVRVYAEAATSEEANWLAEEAIKIIKKNLGEA